MFCIKKTDWCKENWEKKTLIEKNLWNAKIMNKIETSLLVSQMKQTIIGVIFHIISLISPFLFQWYTLHISYVTYEHSKKSCSRSPNILPQYTFCPFASILLLLSFLLNILDPAPTGIPVYPRDKNSKCVFKTISYKSEVVFCLRFGIFPS